MRLIFTFLLLITLNITHAQISVDPAFPTPTSNITVYFDATQGNAALANCNCILYAHAGVITDKSTGPSDWKYVQGNWGTDDPKVKMTKVSDNLYSLTYNIQTFYNVPGGEVIKQLSFVFRNQSGTVVGRTATGGDIYYNFPDPNAGLQYIIEKPSLESRVVSLGSTLDFKTITSKPAQITLKLNDMIIAEAMDATELSHQMTLNTIQAYNYKLFILAGTDGVDTSFTWTVGAPPEVNAVPDGMKLGFNYYDVHEGLVVLEAPGKSVAFLVGDFTNWTAQPTFQMKQSPDGQYLWTKFDTTGMKGNFNYQIWMGDGLKIPDPLSFEILDPNNDKFIEEATYPELPAYPYGKTSGLVSHVNMYDNYQWQNNSFVRPEKGALVIYELLMRDFLQSHDYNDLVDTLTYLKRLGVNAIELMPPSEFEGNISWGYNVSLHNAVDKYYGSPEKLKYFIDQAHGMGMAVISDVVFNHAFGQNPMVQLYWDAVNNKPAPNNPWFNPDARHPYNVGYDFNHESPSTKRYVKQILSHWLTEYHIDGFRFDLSKGFTQTNNPNDVGKWGQYDASRIAIIKGYADQIKSVSPDAYVILEHFADNAEEKELSDYGCMLWGNITHGYQEAVMGFSSNFSGGYFKNRGWNQPGLVSYMESHDEERLMYKAKSGGSAAGNYNVKDLATGLDRVGMASAFFYTIPGPKMLWQFGELGYDYSINTCPNGTISDNCRTDPKPIKWDYYYQQKRLELYAITSGLIHLKTQFDVFNDGTITYDLGGGMKSINLDNDELKMVVIGNFGVVENSKAITFPTSEWYYNYLGTDSIQGFTSPKMLTYKPGIYKVYLNKKVFNPSISLSSDNLSYNKLNVKVYPNPASDLIYITIPEENSNGKTELSIYDLKGKLLQKRQVENASFIEMSTFDLNNGMYIFKVSKKNNVGLMKLLIQK
mgnify:FL=1